MLKDERTTVKIPPYSTETYINHNVQRLQPINPKPLSLVRAWATRKKEVPLPIPKSTHTNGFLGWALLLPTLPLLQLFLFILLMFDRTMCFGCLSFLKFDSFNAIQWIVVFFQGFRVIFFDIFFSKLVAEF